MIGSWRDSLDIVAVFAESSGVHLREFVWACEEAYIRRIVKRTGGHLQRAARILGMERTTLSDKIRKRHIYIEELANKRKYNSKRKGTKDVNRS